jgi:hypothetical protein
LVKESVTVPTSDRLTAWAKATPAVKKAAGKERKIGRKINSCLTL